MHSSPTNPKMVRRTLAALAAIAVTATALSACGSSDTTADESAAAAEPASAPPVTKDCATAADAVLARITIEDQILDAGLNRGATDTSSEQAATLGQTVKHRIDGCDAVAGSTCTELPSTYDSWAKSNTIVQSATVTANRSGNPTTLTDEVMEQFDTARATAHRTATDCLDELGATTGA